MKLKTFATATTTLFGAALISYGQTTPGTTGSRAAPSSPADKAQQEQADANPGTGTPATPGTTGDRSQSTTPDPASPEDQAGQAGQAQPGAQQQQRDITELSETKRAALAELKRDINWMNAEQKPLPLAEAPQAVKDTLRTVTEGQALNQQLTLLTKNDLKVFRATVDRENEEDLHIFVQQDGTVVQTKQKLDFADAPQSVKNAIQQELGDNQAQPKELYRVIADGETTFVAATGGEGAQAQMIQVDNTGNIIEDPQGDAEYAAGQGRPASGARPQGNAGQAAGDQDTTDTEEMEEEE